MGPTAKSLVLDLLSTLRRGSMPVGTLVEAGRLFGIAENSVRVALTRLRVAGRVERDVRGRYRLGAGAQAVGRRVTSWREIERRVRRWDGAWIGVLEGAGGRDARRREAALRFLGLRSLTPVLAVRPANLRGGVDGIRADLAALGLPAADRVFEVRGLDAVTEARARGLWHAEALPSIHRALRAEVEASARRLEALPVEGAMVESFLLGGRVIRQLVLDPLLPDPIVPRRERDALIAAMRRYDRAGRACWAPFMRDLGLPHRHTPADLRTDVSESRLAAEGA